MSSSSAWPSPRMGMASAVDALQSVWYLYGGWSGASTGNATANGGASIGGVTSSAYQSDLWSFSFQSQRWSLITQPNDATEFPTPSHPLRTAFTRTHATPTSEHKPPHPGERSIPCCGSLL